MLLPPKILVIDNGSNYINDLLKFLSLYSSSVHLSKYSDKYDFNNYDIIVLSGGIGNSVKYDFKNFKHESEQIKNTSKLVIGICLGSQIIAHTYSENLDIKDNKKYINQIREINVVKENIIFGNIKNFTAKENHHWTVKKLNKPLEELAISADGIELFTHINKKIFGMQFHPEQLTNKTEDYKIFSNIINCYLEQKLQLPAIGFGTYKLFDNLKTGLSKYYTALEAGYSLIDTAEHYNNHSIIGKINKKLIKNRADIQIITKLWRNSLDYKSVLSKTDRFLNELETDYIDCLLIHWPNSLYSINETIGAMNELLNKGTIKSYGISNFSKCDIENININNAISYNQVEFHPLLFQKELYKYCSGKNIKLMSHTSLAGGKCLENKSIVQIAEKNNTRPAVLVYSWLINKNIIPIIGLGTNDQIKENLKALAVTLNEQDVKTLDSLNENYRSLNKSYASF